MTALDTEKAKRARTIMAERFLNTPDFVDTPPPQLVSFPAYVMPGTARFRQDGSISVTFTVPAQFAKETYLAMMDLIGQTVSVSAETIEIPDA